MLPMLTMQYAACSARAWCLSHVRHFAFAISTSNLGNPSHDEIAVSHMPSGTSVSITVARNLLPLTRSPTMKRTGSPPSLADQRKKTGVKGLAGDPVSHWRRHADGLPTIAYSQSIRDSLQLTATFNKAGIPAEHVDGTMDHGYRDAAVQRFIDGTTLVLSNCELFGEGFDVPAIEAVILLRPTKSLGLHLQQVGRSLRPVPGKSHAIILDHAGNSLFHGLPDDEREWSLEDRPKKKKGEAAKVRIMTCKECFHVYRPASKCPACGNVSQGGGREIEQREGELAEIDPAALRAARKQEERGAKTIADLIRLGEARGYKNARVWAEKFHAARQAARRTGRSTFA